MGQGDSKLGSAMIDKLVSTTNYTEDEIRTMHELFIDEYPTGKCTIGHFEKLLKDIFPNGNVHHFAQHVFRIYDSGGR